METLVVSLCDVVSSLLLCCLLVLFVCMCVCVIVWVWQYFYLQEFERAGMSPSDRVALIKSFPK